MKAKILITDYSSVAYDFYYLNKPIVFFQFDREEYQQKVGSYVDLDKELFGEGVHSIKECVEKIEEIAGNNFEYSPAVKENMDKMRSMFLKYTDKENCKRVYELIIKKLGEKNGKK